MVNLGRFLKEKLSIFLRSIISLIQQNIEGIAQGGAPRSKPSYTCTTQQY